MSEAHHDHDGVKPGAEAGHYARRIRAIEALLIEKGVLTREDVRRQIEYMEARSPANGAKLVARAWMDPEFKACLLSDTKAAAMELGIDASGPVEFVVVKNTPEVHNLIVCTICSCYPRAILGRPTGTRASTTAPALLKSPALSCASSASSSRPVSRLSSMTARPTYATWSCRCARLARRAWARKSSQSSSRETP